MHHKKKSFTFLLGIFLVMGLVLILMENQNYNTSQNNNAQRLLDLQTLMTAIGQYQEDNGYLNSYLPKLANVAQEIASGPDAYDLCPLLVPTYLAALPVDPAVDGAYFKGCNDYSTEYTLFQDANARVLLAAPAAENGSKIKLQQS